MGLRVTAIEDSPASQHKLLDILPQQGALQWIRTAPFFDVQIEKAIRDFNPHLIVLDLSLGEEGVDLGLRVLRQLKSSPFISDIPVAVCSLYVGTGANDKTRAFARKSGAAIVLPKDPFPDLATLLSVVKEKE